MRYFVVLSVMVCLPLYGDHRELPRAKDAPPLKLETLVNEAIEKNSELKAQKAETEMKEAEIGPSGSYEDPLFGFEAMNYRVDNFRPDDSGMTGNQISLSQKIPFPGKLTKKRDAARQESEAQREVAKTKVLEVAKKVKLAYYSLYLAYRKYDTLNEQKGLFDQLTTVTRNNYALNKTTQAEVLNFQVESAGLIDQILGIERQIKATLGELNHLLGRWDHSAYLYGRPEELKKIPFDFHKLSEKALLDLALAGSPAIAEKKAKLEAAESRASFARRGYLPDFEFKLGYTVRQPTGMDAGTDFVSGMVGISIPLWAGVKQSEEVRGASASKVRAEALLDEERNMLAHQLHVTYAELEEANKRVELFEGGVLPLTRQAVTSARSAYLTGKLEYSTLLNAINRRFQMEVSFAESLAQYQSKIAELEALVGKTLGSGI